MFKLTKQVFIALLTLIWVDFLGVCFEGGGKSTPPPPVKNSLELC